MSCQQVFQLLDRVNFPLEHYQVYSYLRRLGYIVMRTTLYDADDNVDDNSESKILNTDNANTNNNVNNTDINNVNNETSGDMMKENAEERPLVETTKNDKNDAFWKRTQIIQPATSERIENLSARPMNQTSFRIHYDIYKPSKRHNFRKTNPGPPSLRVSICKFEQAPPSVGELEELSVLSHPVPVKFCVLNDGVINFLSMHPIVTDMILN